MLPLNRSRTIRVVHHSADEVYLTGDFNRWAVPGVAMKRATPGCWEALIMIPVTGNLAAAVFHHGRVVAVIRIDTRDNDTPLLTSKLEQATT